MILLTNMTKEELEEFEKSSNDLAAVFSMAWNEALTDAKNRK